MAEVAQDAASCVAWEKFGRAVQGSETQYGRALPCVPHKDASERALPVLRRKIQGGIYNKAVSA